MLPRYSGKYCGDIKKPMAGDWAYMILEIPKENTYIELVYLLLV